MECSTFEDVSILWYARQLSLDTFFRSARSITKSNRLRTLPNVYYGFVGLESLHGWNTKYNDERFVETPCMAQFHGSAYHKQRIGVCGCREFCASSRAHSTLQCILCLTKDKDHGAKTSKARFILPANVIQNLASQTNNSHQLKCAQILQNIPSKNSDETSKFVSHSHLQEVWTSLNNS